MTNDIGRADAWKFLRPNHTTRALLHRHDQPSRERLEIKRFRGNIITADHGSVSNDTSQSHFGRTKLISLGSQLLAGLGRLLRRTPFLLTTTSGEPKPSLYGDRYLKRLLYYLFAGTRGGPSRVEIIKAIRDRPSNANQLAQILRVDYKTIQHHVRVLEENGLIVPSEKGTYGAVLFLTPKMEEALPILNEIWGKIGRSKINKTTTEQGD